MNQEKRSATGTVPRALPGALNEVQMATLAGLEKFGWTLEFVRQPLFLEPVPVVISPDGKTKSIINQKGKLEEATHIKHRDAT